MAWGSQGKRSIGKRSDRNITPRLHPKLRRRITYERRESEVDVRRDRGTHHVGNGNVVIIKVLEGRMRTRGGTRAWVTATDTRVFWDHSSGTWRRDRTRLGGGGRRGRRGTRTRMTQRATSLRVAGTVDLTYGTDIPLTVDADMSKVVTFEARLVIARMVAREWGIDWYAVNGSSGINFVAKFSALEGQFDFGGEWGRGSGWERLRVGRHS